MITLVPKAVGTGQGDAFLATTVGEGGVVVVVVVAVFGSGELRVLDPCWLGIGVSGASGGTSKVGGADWTGLVVLEDVVVDGGGALVVRFAFVFKEPAMASCWPMRRKDGPRFPVVEPGLPLLFSSKLGILSLTGLRDNAPNRPILGPRR